MKALSWDVTEYFDAKLYLFVPILSTSYSGLLTRTYRCTSDVAAYA